MQLGGVHLAAPGAFEAVEVTGLSSEIFAIASGGNHSCALFQDEPPMCWGSDDQGQLGSRDTLGRPSSPTVVDGVTGAIAVAAGYHHTCMIASDGRSICFGENEEGQTGAEMKTGDGLKTNVPYPLTLTSATVNAPTSGNPRLFELSTGQVLGGPFTHYCILENQTDQDLCSFVAGSSLPSTFLVSNATGNKTLSIWLSDRTDPARPRNSARLDTNPVPFVPSVALATLSSGLASSCSVQNGAVYCWGQNKFSGFNNHAPTLIQGLSNVESIFQKDDRFCATTQSHAVYCWGQIKIGGISQTMPTPTLIPAFEGAVSIALGGETPCAIREDQTMVCLVSMTSAFSFPEITDPAEIVAGKDHTCVLRTSGVVSCWGQNNYGQLGNNSTNSSSTPVTVLNVNGAISIAAGDNHTCVALSSGSVHCWGRNQYLQMGKAYGSEAIPNPVFVPGIDSAERVSAHSDHTCALSSSGSVKCWGANGSGQLGIGTKSAESDATISVVRTLNLDPLQNVVNVSVGRNHSCAELMDGSTTCWGRGAEGQLGHGMKPWTGIPIAVQGLSPTHTDGKPSFLLDLGSAFSCSLHSKETSPKSILSCWGSTFGLSSSLGTKYTGSVLSLSVGDSHACMSLSDGTARCFGSNYNGQLGNGTNVDSDSPVSVSLALDPFLKIAAGGAHTCGIKVSGDVHCWGQNSYSQLNDGTTFDRNVPVWASMPDKAVWAPYEIAAGGYHTCAIGSGSGGSGIVRCWGSNSSNQLGRNGVVIINNVPVPVHGVSNAIKISAGFNHTCALTTNQEVYCWGGNGLGQLGLGNDSPQNLPQKIPEATLTHPIAIAAGGGHTCALLASGRIRCFGNNSLLQLGAAVATNTSAIPVEVPGIEDAIAISAGSNHSCATLSDRSVKCWGFGVDGRLGGLFPDAIYETAVANTRVFGIDRDPGTPQSTITLSTSGFDGTLLANGTNQSVVTVQLINDSGSGMTGVQPELRFNDMSTTQPEAQCEFTDSQGNSNCTIKSTKAGLLQAWLVQPIVMPVSGSGFPAQYPSNTIRFSQLSPTNTRITGSSILTRQCSEEPYFLTLVDSNQNPTQATTPTSLTLAEAPNIEIQQSWSFQVFADPQCTLPLSNQISFSAGETRAFFYLKSEGTASGVKFLHVTGAYPSNDTFSVIIP